MIQGLLYFALIGAGAVCLRAGYLRRRAARATLKWPMAQGTILSTHLHTQLRSGYKSATTVALLDVEYEYVVNGKTYRGTRRTIDGTPEQSMSEAEALAETWTKGATVWVSHNPANPADAVLEHNSPRGNIYMLTGAVFILTPLYFWLRARPHV